MKSAVAAGPAGAWLHPGPFTAFDVGCRAAGLALAVGAVRAVLAGGVAHPSLLVSLSAYGLLALLRVPSAGLVLEVVAADLLLAGLASQPAPLALAACTLALLAVRPESGALRLNGLDRYFVAHGYGADAATSAFQPSVHFFVDTREELDRAALDAAAAALAAEVPTCRSFVRVGAWGAERFAAASPWFDTAGLVERPAGPVEAWEEAHFDDPFDLARRPPFRLHAGPRTAGGFRLGLSIHHSAGDGTGGLLLLDRLFQRYNELLEGRPAEPFPRERRPRFRELFGEHPLSWRLAMVRRHVRPLDKVGVTNASLLEDETPRPWRRALHVVTIGGERLERLRAAAQAAGLTVNDLLVASALRAADAWRRARGKPDRAFRVLLPTDLRPTLGLAPSLGNYVGVVRSEFAPEEVRASDLPARVSDRVRLGRTFEEAIETPVNLGVVSAVLPTWAFRKALHDFDNDPRSFFFSFLFSHVRVPHEQRLPARATVERLWVRASVPRQPGVGMLLTAAAAQLTIAIDYLVPLLSDEGAAAFAAGLAEELDRAGGLESTRAGER
ncbi:MAG: hypothetical protein HYZ53_01450 [Planctomycetes bacterium]|nr:hypothetical protein [Planctomycetota bacterium]